MEEIEVDACEIDEHHIYYRCPSCYTIQGGRVVRSCFKGNGQFYRSAEHTIHKHGSAGNYDNRIEHRSSHCIYDKRPVKIRITDETKKPVLPVIMNKKQGNHNPNAFVVSFK